MRILFGVVTLVSVLVFVFVIKNWYNFAHKTLKYTLLLIALVTPVALPVALGYTLFLTKVVATLMLPIGFIWMTLGIATIVLFSIKRKPMALLCMFWFFFLGITCNVALGRLLLRTLESPYVNTNPLAENQTYDVVVVLGGGVGHTPWGFSQTLMSGDRAVLAARLFKEGKTDLLISSDTSTKGEGDIPDTSVIWESLGIGKDKMMMLDHPYNTTEEFKQLALLQKEKHWKRIGLLTSAWHMQRALRLAEKYGLKVYPLPADFQGYVVSESNVSFIPTGRGAFLIQTAVWEYLGMLVGR